MSSAPRIIPRLSALIKDPNMNPEDVVALIRMDPHLSLRLLTACKNRLNGEAATSIQQAINLLGYTEVYRLAVIAVLRHSFPAEVSVYDLSADLLWRRALITGIYMEEFAAEADQDMDEAFTIGLLHIVGMHLINWNSYCIPGGRIPTSSLEEQIREERERLDLDFLEISAIALSQWGFPAPITQSIAAAASAALPDESHYAKELRAAIQLSKLYQAADPRLVRARLPPATPRGQPIEPLIERVQDKIEATLRQFHL